MTSDISSITALSDFAAVMVSRLTSHTNRATVVILSGDLGAGKTTLVQQLGRQLGITTPITSPTYTIMQTYELPDAEFRSFVHMDAYRIDSLSELTPLRFTELLTQPQTLLCIEWGSKIEAALPVIDMRVDLMLYENEVRTGTVLTA